MKRRFLTIYFAIICIFSIGQERKFNDGIYSEPVEDTYNFSILDGKIIWQYVFEYSGTFEELAVAAGASTSLHVNSAKDGTITAVIPPYFNDYKAFGKRLMNTSMLISQSKMSGTAYIQYKQGRYRVTITDITFDIKHPMYIGASQTIEYFALKGGKKNKRIGEDFITDVAPIIDLNLKKKFAFGESGTRLDDDF